MSLISVKNISKNFGIKPLLTNLSFAITQGERIAIVGANGSGKSTLLNIITGAEEPDNGEIIKRRDTSVSYIHQSEVLSFNKSIRDVLELEKLELTQDYHDKIITDELIQSAGFDDLDKKTNTLSGGWLKRLSIVNGLLKNPDLLILDEPTNHLDINGILWLEETILASQLTLICVSHDRYFLERIATRTIELDARYPSGFIQVEGGYSDLLEKRSELLATLTSQKSSLANKVRREVEWLRQGAKARSTKSKHRTEEAHKLISELNSINLKEMEIDFEFSSTQRKTKDLVKLENVAKGFPDKHLINNLSLIFKTGSRIGIVGANGTGKTTLLKLIIGKETPDKGKITRASNLQYAFFGQHREQLKPEMTISNLISPDADSVVFNDRSIHISSWIRRFAFRHDQLNQQIKSLSGGEQARLLLAKLMLEPADILIFDEPTNDLDIQTLEILEQSFVTFPGAIVLVTHDRYMMDRVCTQLIGLRGNGQVDIYSDYLQFENSLSELTDSVSASSTSKHSGQKSGLSHEERKELQSIERKINRIENDIETKKAAMHKSSEAQKLDKLQAMQDEINDLESELAVLIERWEFLEKIKFTN